MRYKSGEFRTPAKRWSYPSNVARTSVQSILGVALIGSVSTVMLVFAELVVEQGQVKPIIVLWLGVLSLGACWIAKFIYDLRPPRRRRTRSRTGSETIPPEVARDVRRGFRRCSDEELERIAASSDLEDWYRRILEGELRRRMRQHKWAGNHRRSRAPRTRTAESDLARAGRR